MKFKIHSLCLYLSLLLACAIFLFSSSKMKGVEGDSAKAGDKTIAAGKDFGITPETPETLQAGIDKAYQAGFKKIIIPPGVYRVPRPDDTNWHLVLVDMKNFEIDATGVTFVSLGRDKRSIRIDRCENVTLRGLTLTREIPPFSQGKIESIAEDRESVAIRIDAGYPADITDRHYFPRIPIFNCYIKGTRLLKPLVPDMYVSRVERIEPGLFRFHLRKTADPRIPLEVGDPVAWRGPSGADICVWASQQVCLENVTVKNGTGIAYMEIGGEGFNQYKHCIITYADPPEGAKDLPLLACATDGFHSASTRHGPLLENCSFEGLNDDQVNIHGTYAMVMEVQGTKVILDWRTPFDASHELDSPTRPGDVVRFYDTRGAFCGEAVAVSTEPNPNYKPRDLGHLDSRTFSNRERAVYWTMNLDHPVSVPTTGLAANIRTVGSGFIIRNCSFRNNRGHGLLIRASDGLIEGCTIEGTLMGGIIIAPELNSWNESDYPRNITIRNNTLRNVGVAMQPWNGSVTVAGFEFGRYVPLPGGPRDIFIRDNVFENNRGVNIVLTSTINAEITGNHFIKPMSTTPYRTDAMGVDNDKALIWIRESDKVKLSGNTVTSPGAYFEKLVDTDATVTGVEGLEKGVVLTPEK